MIALTLVKPSCYSDSVALLALARELRALPGIVEAAALMATPANRDLLAQAGLLTAEADDARPNDLVVVIRGEPADAERARERAEQLLAARRAPIEAPSLHAPRTLDRASERLAGANLALISVPGVWAAAEARRALDRGLHVMLFSDNVSLEDELTLKREAARRGLLVMGPDCGTAYLGGVPLGFANAVPRGRIGIVAASGTGLQQVATLLVAGGEGISQGIGVGGRDMSSAVGGLMALAAIDALGEDPATEIVIVIGKPPAPSVRHAIHAKLGALGKPSVIALLGPDVTTGRQGRVTTVASLEDAARATLAALGGAPWTARAFSLAPSEIRARVQALRRELEPGQSAVRGLYAGGTLAHEAALILEPLLGPVASNFATGSARHHVLDLGADEHTIGRAHPMLDVTERVKAIASAAEDGDVAVLLLDVVLGHGAATDPAGDVAPALEAARQRARARGRGLAIVASVIGAEGDPQGLARQTARLEEIGAWVLPSNAQAARAAACIAGGAAVVERLLAEMP
jgi:FdrA protein